MRILLGISGSIAAYKIIELVRRLREEQHEIQIIMTEAAQHFITPLSFQAVAGSLPHTHLFDPAAENGMGHIELARWADLLLIAPASADILARMAHGLANDLLTTCALTTTAQIVVAPAMNQQMWAHPATQHNMELLRERGVLCWGPAVGEQVCGETGAGRMLEPAEILYQIQQRQAPRVLLGQKVLISAGPTREGLDPVRYLTNHSSGKMGFAIAHAAQQAGAEVTLVTGPVALSTPSAVQRINVTTALEMHKTILKQAATHDIFISTAAVADYRPQEVARQKVKKTEDVIQLELVKNPDIVADVGKMQPHPFLVGFAAETERVAEYALQKLESKHLDMICANDVSANQVFDQADNALHVFWADGDCILSRQPKESLARELIQLVAAQFVSESLKEDE